MLDTGKSRSAVDAVMFQPQADGMYVFGESMNVIHRWRLADGQEVGKQAGLDVLAISTSKDQKWIVCGALYEASVWDAEMQQKVFEVEIRNAVFAVDVSPDSTRFATGIGGSNARANIWSITTGELLVGGLKHDEDVRAIRFSPDGELVALCSRSYYRNSVRVFDSHSGNETLNITDAKVSRAPNGRSIGLCPIAWSNDGQQIFVASDDCAIKSFHVPTGSKFAESQILSEGGIESVALAANGKFLVTFAGYSIFFLDTSTLGRIGPAIEGKDRIRSVAISPDSSYLATGRYDGKIVIQNLSSILPDSYGPFYASICTFFVSGADILC